MSVKTNTLSHVLTRNSAVHRWVRAHKHTPRLMFMLIICRLKHVEMVAAHFYTFLYLSQRKSQIWQSRRSYHVLLRRSGCFFLFQMGFRISPQMRKSSQVDKKLSCILFIFYPFCEGTRATDHNLSFMIFDALNWSWLDSYEWRQFYLV